MKDQSNKKTSEKISRVEFGVEFGNINANKFMDLPQGSSKQKGKRQKKK